MQLNNRSTFNCILFYSLFWVVWTSLICGQNSNIGVKSGIDYSKIKVLILNNVHVMLDDSRNNEEKYINEFILKAKNDTLEVQWNNNIDDRSRYLILSLKNLEKIECNKGGVWIENCSFKKMIINCNAGGISTNGVEYVETYLTYKSSCTIKGAKSIKFSASDICTVRIESSNTEISGTASDEAEITIKGDYINKGITQKGNPIISEIKN